eukprot:COSAG02_NODE_3689_length_6380_cov_11.454705_1_plen_227_part_00
MFSKATSAFVVLLAEEQKTILAVKPKKHVPRPRKDGKGMTKGSATPWTLPGGKVEGTEDSKSAMIRELEEETGLKFGDLEPVHFRTESRVSEAKADIYLYTIPTEVPAHPGAEIAEVKWTPAEQVMEKAHYLMQRALFVTGGILWTVNEGTLTLRESGTDGPAVKRIKTEPKTIPNMERVDGAPEPSDDAAAPSTSGIYGVSEDPGFKLFRGVEFTGTSGGFEGRK